MALNLGDINFGLGVDTRRLSSSVRDVVNFGQAVERASSRSGAASKKVAADLRAQERAALSALQQTLRFNEAARRAGAPSQILNSSTRAFSDYTKAVTSGQLATLQFQRAQSKFQADMGRSTRALNQFRQSVNQTNLSGFTTNMSNLASAATLAVGPLSGIAARITAITAIANRSNLAVVGLIGGLTAAGLTLNALGRGAVTTAIELDKVNARLTSVTGSAFVAAERFAELQDLADRTGTELVAVANGYAKLAAASQGTNLQGEATAQIFEDILFGAAQFRIGQEELNGTLKAFEQIMSKGIVQAEELRGQLGDRLVGAFNIAAKSMGVTTAELNRMLRAGEVLSDEFLPKFAATFREAVGADQVKRVEGLQASINRFANSLTAFNAAFDETFGISQLFQDVLDTMSGFLNTVAANMDNLAAAAGAVTGAILALAAPRILTGIIALGGIIRSVTLAMLGLNAAILANPLAGVAAILARVGIAAAGAVAGFTVVSSAVASTTDAQAELIESVDQYIASQRRMQEASTDTTRSLIDNVNKQLNAILEASGRLEQIEAVEFELKALVSQQSAGLPVFGIEDQIREVKAQLDELRSAPAIEFLSRDELAKYEALQQRLDELNIVLQSQIELENQRNQAQERTLTAAEEGAIQAIQRLNAETQSLALGAGAIEALKASFQQTDAIEQFEDKLKRAGVEAELIAGYVADFTLALDDLRRATQETRLEDAADQIERIRQEIEATTDGAGALERLKQSFAISDAADSLKQSLIGAGISLEQATVQADQLASAMFTLDETVRQQRTSTAIAEITAEIDRMNQEAIALQQGEEAVRRLQQQFDNTQSIEAFSQRLADAGVESSILEGLIGSLTGALFRLQSVAGQVRIDAALDSAATATDRLRRETEALAGGKDAFESFRNAERVASNLASLESSLKEAGAGEAEIAAQLAEREAALNANIAAQEAYDASLRKSSGGSGRKRGRSKQLSEEEKQLQRLSEATATLNSLQETLAAGAVDFTVFEKMALDTEATTEAIQGAVSSVESLIDKAATLSNVDLMDLRDFGLEGAENIAMYTRALEAMGLQQDAVNQRLQEYKQTLADVTNEERALQQIADIFANVQETIQSGWESVADSMAEALVSGKFDLTTLADIGAQVATELLANFLKLAVIRPLLNSIFGNFVGGGGATFGQLTAGAGGNFFGTLFSRKGNAFGVDGPLDVSFARKGALLTGPTAFGTSDGGITIGGEAGDEGILPLARDSAGDLGVIVAGGSTGNTINFNFPPGTDVESFRKSESQMAAMAARIAQRGGRNL